MYTPIYWSSNTLATWWEELIQRPWCWERLKVGGEGDDKMRCLDGTLTLWTWVWVSSGSWWWTGKPGVLQSMGSPSRTRLSDWTELSFFPETCWWLPLSFSYWVSLFLIFEEHLSSFLLDNMDVERYSDFCRNPAYLSSLWTGSPPGYP